MPDLDRIREIRPDLFESRDPQLTGVLLCSAVHPWGAESVGPVGGRPVGGTSSGLRDHRRWPNLRGVKATDDIHAKVRFWVEESSRPGYRPRPCPVPINLPRFSRQCFSSYPDLNEWKRRYLLEVARLGGVQWKRSSTD
jgi:hypothetical protein